MSATIGMDCPYCGVKKIVFYLVTARPLKGNAYSFDAMFACGGCDRSVLAYVRYIKPATPSTNVQQLLNIQGDIAGRGFIIDKIFPEPRNTEAPPYTPDNVARFFRQAIGGLNSGHWDTAGTLARKTLDAATLRLDDSFKDKEKLHKRIDALADDNRITPELKEWAHAIRLDGNDSAHDPTPETEEDARQICNFVETFLEYVFTLPGELKARRERKGMSEQKMPEIVG